jgi:hypothetical protein
MLLGEYAMHHQNLISHPKFPSMNTAPCCSHKLQKYNKVNIPGTTIKPKYFIILQILVNKAFLYGTPSGP